MGGSKSKQNMPTQQQINRLDGVKHIVLLHHSESKKENERVRKFKDVLVQSAPGSINITDTFNLAKKVNPRDITWLDEPQNIILIRLTPEGINTITEVARSKQYLDENNRLHARVLSVAFGNSLPNGWPPLGAKHAVPDQRDFCLGQQNPDDEFDDSKIRALVSAIMAA